MICWLLLPPVRDGSDWSSMSRIAIGSGCLVEDTVPFGSSSTVPGNRFLYRLRGRGPLYGYNDISVRPRVWRRVPWQIVRTIRVAQRKCGLLERIGVRFALVRIAGRYLDWWCAIRDCGDIRWRIRLMFRVGSEFLDGVVKWPTRYCDALCLILRDRDVLLEIPPF